MIICPLHVGRGAFLSLFRKLRAPDLQSELRHAKTITFALLPAGR